jgi:acyl carrier protein
MTMNEDIRQIISQYARLPVDMSTVDDGADLFSAGMTSHASVNVMLALEETFDIEFPEAMLRKRTFESVRAIAESVSSLIELTADSAG